jgi:hypothetical protein
MAKTKKTEKKGRRGATKGTVNEKRRQTSEYLHVQQSIGAVYWLA